MARITSREMLINYIKSQLGYPTIQIEVTDGQISNIIDDSIQKFTEYAYGTLEGAVVLQVNGAGTYALPDLITNIIKLSKGSSASGMGFSQNFGAGLVPDMWSSQYFNMSSGSNGITSVFENILPVMNQRAIVAKYFGDDLNCNFNPHKKVLQVLENYNGKALLHYNYEYVADEEYDAIFNHEWIKAYTKAQTKFLWGGITGKFSQSLVGGATINYSDFKSEAQNEIDKLNEDLLNKWSDPCPISIA